MKRRRRLHDDGYTTTTHENDDEYNDYSHLLHDGVIIEDQSAKVVEEEEYITNFYTRVRAKRRALLNQYDDTSSYSTTSLDHSLPSSTTSSSELLQYGSSSTRDDDEETEFDTTHNTAAARSIRGGSSFWRKTRHQETLVDVDYYAVDDSDEEEEKEEVEQDVYDDNVPSHPSIHHHDHCNGLLRIPCSIVIKSESGRSIETTSLDFPPSPVSAVTSVSAYVDTGATVTVISAAAAKRVGIYHLIDRRYAGRATGVGQCRVLGRIPAHHVSFLLGGDDDDEKEIDDYYVKNNPRSVRGGGLNHNYYDKKKYNNNNNNNNGLIQMDGPALTVIEGTVTKGVDVLLGLDVLQDWEAEIRIGGPIQTMTVREKKKTVVIPFATSTMNDSSSRRTSEHGMNRYSSGVGSIARDNHEIMSTHDHRHRRYSNDNDTNKGIEYDSNDNDDYDEDDDDPYFSPTLTDIESDLDLLDKSGHEFPYHQDVRKITSIITNKQRNKVDDDIVNDDRDYYLHDDEDEEVEKIDMSGL
jgi:hypothetical protein